MTDRTFSFTHHHHEEFYSKKQIFISSDTTTTSRKYNYIGETIGIGRMDTACSQKSTCNGHQIVHQVDGKTSHKEKNVINGHSNVRVNGSSEPKSFIQQRVERLYGPGALAQGFFVMKRQKSHSSESDAQTQMRDKLNVSIDNDKHSKSMSDKLLLDADYDSDSSMKQSASSPSLPVLRHLTPEFRAQLPTFSPRRGTDTIIQKSTTLPQIKASEMLSDDVITLTQNASTLQEDDKKYGDTKSQAHRQNQHLRENNNCLNGNGGEGDSIKVEKPSETPCAENDHNEVKDGHYFLRILENETIRLLELADKAESELTIGEHTLNENAKGFLRSASGKARLLVSQKMQQFRGLCTNNLNQAEGEAFPTTNQDLQGFWDMVMLQVDQIDSLFKELDVMRANNWQEVEKPVDTVDNKKPLRPKVTAQASRTRNNTGVEEARAKREAQRKLMIEQRRKAMRESKKQSVNSERIEIFVPESS